MNSPNTPEHEFIRPGQPVATATRSVVLVPGEDVPLFKLDLPQGLRGAAREQVARRQVSDRLGLNPDQVQIRPFDTSAKTDQWTHVMVADPDFLAQWRTLSGRAVLPDYLALPCADGLWVFDTAADSIQARLGPHDGFSAGPIMLITMLDCALTELGKPKAIFLCSEIAQVRDWAKIHGMTIVTGNDDLEALGLPVPTVLGHGELSCDLRADPMAARARLARRVLPWRWSLLAGALAATLFAAQQIIAIQQIQAKTERIQQTTLQTIDQSFPNIGPILDIRQQVSRALAQQRAAQSPDGAVDPIELGWRVAQVVTTANAKPEQLSFTAPSGVTLLLQVSDFAAVDAIIQDFRDAGLTPKLLDSRATTDAQGVRAEFLIQPETSP